MVLRNADTRVAVDAAHGGAIREFSWRSMAILRPAVSSTDTDPMSTSCFPLVPYANRIAEGRFAFDAQEVRLRRNWDRDPHPLHGQGWRSAWTVEHSAEARATLAFDGGGDDWPWRYRALQEFQVLADGLEITLSVANQSDGTMPAMLGLHPYFPQPAAVTVQARARTVWLTDAQALPVQEVMTPQDWSFERPRRAARVELDHCFDHWDGTAVMTWPDRVLRMKATGAHSLHVYTPASADFFCLEPQTAAAGALQRTSAAVAQLAPGESVAMKVRFSVEQA
ncbi:MAG TPA: aldose 1-epimerase [Steroidobacteraceae bacterium]|jgi:aldose 1-epimerase|nr:aldose 1-epimerase [Steroidobacteraceae bacterium]